MVYCADDAFVNQSQEDYTSIKKRSNRKRCGSKIARPLNAFMIYRTERKVLFNSRLHSSEVSKLVGEMWRKEPDAIKAVYERRAEKMKLEHLLKYPEYRYLPQSKKKASTKRHDNDILSKVNNLPATTTTTTTDERSSVCIIPAENLNCTVSTVIVDPTTEISVPPSAMLNAADILPEWSNMNTTAFNNDDLYNGLQFETDLEALISFYISTPSLNNMIYLF